MTPWRIPFLTAVMANLASFAAAAPAPTPDQVEFFEKKIRPVLAQQCYKCHSESQGKTKGGLTLDTAAGLAKGGGGGAAVVPGKPAQSSLIKAIRWTNDDLKMPPKVKLDDQVIRDFEQWVSMGAPWPGAAALPVTEKSSASPSSAPNYAAQYNRIRQELWSWQPIRDPATPQPRNSSWAKSDIDRFVLAKLEEKELSPSPPAEKLSLLRRASFDLIGLPPTPEEIDAFVRDNSAGAFEKAVDRMLASPRFGERWGRHWLDVARYAESSGFTRNLVYSYAWRYRDWVIDAFNADKPYDRFITEQLAGDLLPVRSPEEKDKNVIATGFLCIGTRDFNERNARQFEYNAADEMIDTTGRAFLATTIACARCHDHKFDAIPQSEYYSIAGIFVSSKEFTGLERRRGAKINQHDESELIALSDFKAGPPAKKPQSEDEIRKQARESFQKLYMQRVSGADYSRPISSIKPLAMGMKDDNRPGDVRVLVRGELSQPGDTTPRGFLSIPCIKNPPTISPGQSGRWDLARWITHKDNPLTARVAVNRIWQHLFGYGLVRSVDNFGTTGERPSHPELLDYLAIRFVQDGWSVKGTIKRIMMSAAYQQSASFDRAKYAVDPDNTTLWRQNQRRLEAEAIRDTMLMASGKLNLTPPVASLALDMPPAPLNAGKGRFNPADFVAGSSHRSVYLPIFRDLLPESLDVFDFADASNVTGQRDVTTVPPQALYLLNNPFVMRQSKEMATRVISAKVTSDLARVDLAYKLALGRPASATERDRAASYISNFMRDPRAAVAKDVAQNRVSAWASFCQALMGSAEFRYLN